MTKKCTKCLLKKEPDQFGKNKISKDGLKARCKACRNIDGAIYKKENKNKIRNYYLNNKEYISNRGKDYYNKNKDYINKRNKSYTENNIEIINKYQRNYYKVNKENILKSQKEYAKNNRHIYNATQMKRVAAKINATPKWLTKDHLDDIKQVYQDVQDIQWLSEEPFEVDHIIPLRGKNVCGLHVPWNLQILTKSENCSKGNKVLL